MKGGWIRGRFGIEGGLGYEVICTKPGASEMTRGGWEGGRFG